MATAEEKIVAQFKTHRQFWDQLPKEPDECFRCFQLYLQSDIRTRTVTTLMGLTGVRGGLIKRWVGEWLWPERSRALAEFEGDTARFDEKWGDNKLAAHRVDGLRNIQAIDAIFNEVLKHSIYNDTTEVSADGKTTIIRTPLGVGILKDLISYAKSLHDFMTKEVVQKPGAAIGSLTVNQQIFQVMIDNRNKELLSFLERQGVTPEEFMAAAALDENKAVLYRGVGKN